MPSKKIHYPETFNDSYERIFSYENRLNGRDDEFFDLFLELLYSKSSKITEAFNHLELREQKKLLKALLICLISVEGTKSVFPAVEHVAETYASIVDNVSAELYDHWLDSLVETVSVFDQSFNDDTEVAWRMALAPGITFMKYYYKNKSIFFDPGLLPDHHIELPDLHS